jgi:hypothetical protein
MNCAACCAPTTKHRKLDVPYQVQHASNLKVCIVEWEKALHDIGKLRKSAKKGLFLDTKDCKPNMFMLWKHTCFLSMKPKETPLTHQKEQLKLINLLQNGVDANCEAGLRNMSQHGICHN